MLCDFVVRDFSWFLLSRALFLCDTDLRSAWCFFSLWCDVGKRWQKQQVRQEAAGLQQAHQSGEEQPHRPSLTARLWWQFQPLLIRMRRWWKLSELRGRNHNGTDVQEKGFRQFPDQFSEKTRSNKGEIFTFAHMKIFWATKVSSECLIGSSAAWSWFSPDSSWRSKKKWKRVSTEIYCTSSKLY